MCTRNIETHSFNHCSHGKAIIIKYSECVFVDLVIQHVMCMCCIVFCGLSCTTIFLFFRIISLMARFFFLGGGEFLNIKCVF